MGETASEKERGTSFQAKGEGGLVLVKVGKSEGVSPKATTEEHSLPLFGIRVVGCLLR